MGLWPAKSHEKLSGRRLADEILWGRLVTWLVTCGRLAIGPCRLRGGPAAVTNRRAGCQPVPHWFFDPVMLRGLTGDQRRFAYPTSPTPLSSGTSAPTPCTPRDPGPSRPA